MRTWNRATVAVGIALTLMLLAGCLGGDADPVRSSFDDGPEEWTVAGDAQGESDVPDHHDEGGDPGGYVSAEDDGEGETWYWNASPAYLGDKEAYYGGTLSFDLRQSSTTSQFQNTDVVLLGEDGDVLTHDFGDASQHPGENWTAYEVPLEASAWTVGNETDGAAANASDMREVLGDLDEVWIRGEYVTGSDTGGLDDVVLEG